MKNTKHPKHQAVHALPQSGLKPGIAFIFYFKSTILPVEDHCLGIAFPWLSHPALNEMPARYVLTGAAELFG